MEGVDSQGFDGVGLDVFVVHLVDVAGGVLALADLLVLVGYRGYIRCTGDGLVLLLGGLAVDGGKREG